MKFILFIALFFSTSEFVQAQDSTGVIRGYVIDKETGEGIPFGKVYILNTDSVIVGGVYTNVDGQFVVGKIKPGTYFVQVRELAYLVGTTKDIILKPKEIQTLNLYLDRNMPMKKVDINRH